MTSDTAATGFGRYLQALRLEKGITLEKVSEETRIGLGTLKSIEQEVLDELPADVFLKGFLRSYSKVVGADGNEVIRRYESQLEVSRKIAHFEQEPQRLSSGSLWKLAAALLVLALVMLFSIYAIKLWHETDRSARQGKTASRMLPASVAGAPCMGRIGLNFLSPASRGTQTFSAKISADENNRPTNAI